MSGILQVEGLTHQMVGSARCRADFIEVPHETTERWPVRQENREVKQPKATAVGRRARTRAFVEHDQGSLTVLRAKHRVRTVAPQDPKAERRLIERE